MNYCPECGGEMRYLSAMKRYFCRSCGLSLTPQELMEMREQLRTPVPLEVEEKKRIRKEYLEWWLSKKK